MDIAKITSENLLYGETIFRKGGIHMGFQSFWDKFEQSGSVRDYLDYVKNVKSNRNRYDSESWDDDWDDWDDWDDDDIDYDDD